MPPAAWIALGGALFSACAMLIGAFYMRGKLDAHAEAAGKKIDALAARVEKLDGMSNSEAEERGARGERVKSFDKLIDEVKGLARQATETATKLSAHEEGCNRRQDAIWERFDKTDAHMAAGFEKIDRALENVNRQIISLATGQAGRVVEFKRASD